MKKILLLLVMLLFGIIEVNAVDLNVSFYYNEDDKVTGMWINRKKGDELESGQPHFLKMKGSNELVYCIEPSVDIDEDAVYDGYYNIISKFNITDEELERVRLITYFGYGYPGHLEDKWYGITQYMIWETVSEDVEVYFAEERYGERAYLYQAEILEIEFLIEEYQNLRRMNYIYSFEDEMGIRELENSNIFLINNGLNYGHNEIEIPRNIYVSEQEAFFYHEKYQNLYRASGIMNLMGVEIIVGKNIEFKKWYGSGKYKEEEGAIFEIYMGDSLIHTFETNSTGDASVYLDYGTYKVVQVKGKEGYKYIDDFYLEVNQNTNRLIELYDEAIRIEVPNTTSYPFGINIMQALKEEIYAFKEY